MLIGMRNGMMTGKRKIMLPCFYCGFTNFQIPAVDSGDFIEIAFAFDRSWWPNSTYYLCGISSTIWQGVSSGYVAFGHTFADEKCHVVRNECGGDKGLWVDGVKISNSAKNFSGASFVWGSFSTDTVAGTAAFKGWMYWIAVYGSDGTLKRKYVPDETSLKLKDTISGNYATQYRDTPTYLLREF